MYACTQISAHTHIHTYLLLGRDAKFDITFDMYMHACIHTHTLIYWAEMPIL